VEAEDVPAESPRPVVAAAPAPAAAPAEDNVGPLQSLPDAVQRDIPKVAFGGYIYSPNPAERLLLVDKMLRREGEEVAPGLVLERLLPKAAIMNFRGYRYRVAY
jgi:general secretion pathway protein B